MARLSGWTKSLRLVSTIGVCPICAGRKPLGATACWQCQVQEVSATQRLRKVREFGRRVYRDEDGATLIEYTVLLSLMLVGTMGTIGTVGQWASNEWIKIDQALTGDPPSNNNGGGTNNGGSGNDPPPDPPPPIAVNFGNVFNGIVCDVSGGCPESNSPIYTSDGLAAGMEIVTVQGGGVCVVQDPNTLNRTPVSC